MGTRAGKKKSHPPVGWKKVLFFWGKGGFHTRLMRRPGNFEHPVLQTEKRERGAKNTRVTLNLIIGGERHSRPNAMKKKMGLQNSNLAEEKKDFNLVWEGIQRSGGGKGLVPYFSRGRPPPFVRKAGSCRRFLFGFFWNCTWRSLNLLFKKSHTKRGGGEREKELFYHRREGKKSRQFPKP